MTSLVLGVAFGALGQLVGIPFSVGFLVGSLIGSLVDQPKQYGPRLGDLKIQLSTYGRMIPFFWGRGRIAGNIIDQTDLEEHTQKSGGKGGPQVINYTYSASFAIMLGAARLFNEDCIRGIKKIWADGRLIWADDDGTTIPCTVYLGSETQLPDPTFEAIHGVGNVPAYRGYAYVVFTDYYLTDFGNRIPAFEFEVFTGAGEYPWQVNVGNPWFQLNYSVPSFVYDSGIITVGNTSTNTGTFYWQQFDMNLAPVTSAVFSTPGGLGYNAATNDLTIASIDGGSNIHWNSPDSSGVYHEGLDITASNTVSPLQANLSMVSNGFYYSLTGSAPAYISKYALAGGLDLQTAIGAYNHNQLAIGTSDTGDVYVVYTPGGAINAEMWKFDEDLGLVHYWAAADLAGTLLTHGIHSQGNFYVYKDQVVFQYAAGSNRYVALVDINPTSFAATDSVHGPLIQAQEGRFAPLSGGLVMNVNNGVFSLDPPPAAVRLSKIVADLSTMTPIGGAYDVSQLTDEVHWFVIGSQMTIRNAIQALRSCFFFDAVESDDQVRFVKRDLSGDSPNRVITQIPDEDLDARAYGEKSGELLRTIRKKEQDLPRTVSITYIDVDTDYQTGTQSSPRQTTLSQQDVTIEVPVGLTSSEALQKCWTLQTSEWVERESFEWSTTRKWAKLEPTDPVYVRGRVIRIQTKTEQPNGVIKWSGVLAAPSLYITPASSLYVQNAPANPGGFIPPTPPGAKVDTRMILLDLPLLNSADYPYGIYAAVGKATTGSWTGAEIFESIDGGSTYFSVGSSIVEDVIGSVTGTLGNWAGGNNFDESNLLTVILPAGMTLSSVTTDAVLNGANQCVVGSTSGGWEVLQYRTATLIATNTYQLSGLLRGRFGTEWAIPLHASGETFIVLPVSVNLNAPYADLGSSRKYKAVSYGLTMASATAQDFTNNGIAIKPYAPVSLAGGRGASSELILEWIPRTRIGGTWLDFVDVTLSDDDTYEVQLYTDGTYSTVAYGNVFSGPTATITFAELLAAFDSPVPSTFYFDVAQSGLYGFGYAARGSAS